MRKVPSISGYGPVSQRVQINLIFNDNVCLLCLSCNVKNTKLLPNYLKRAETGVVLIVFGGVH